MRPRGLVIGAIALLILTGGAWPSKSPTATVASAAHVALAANGSWTTYHHDNARTGYDSAAAAVGAVAPTVGWTETALDAQIYASPLIYNGLVYAATLNNTVYALNQSTGAVVWSKNLGAPVTTGWGCGNVSPQGILGTPVIDAATGRIYAAALLNTDHLYHVFGLDLNTGTPTLTTTIPATIGAGFDWTIQQERGALAVANGYVYVPFGGRAGDCGLYNGWVVGVPTNGSTSLAVWETPARGSAVWAGGGVVVDDTTGNVFVATGNAVAGGCASVDQNDAVVRLSPTLVMQDYFMPQDWQANWCNNDQDLGSASPVLLSPSLLFQSGKWGGGFLINPNSMGGVDGQRFPTPKPATYAQADVCFGNTSDATFGSFAYVAPFIYVECEGRGLVALNVNTATPSFSPCDAVCAAPDWNAGSGITFGPPIVAGGAVWVADNGSGLWAFNATTGAQIYHSANFGINRFVTPAEAGGQVFVPAKTVIKSFSFGAPLPPPPPGTYTALTPNRLLDTRTSGGPLAAGGTRNLTVTGGSVPANATGVVMNVTATNTTTSSYLTVYPTGAGRPLASNLNWTAGRTVPNLVSVQVGNGGSITFFNGAGSTDVVADLEGYFAPPSGTAGGEVALPPARISDTRPGSGFPNAGSGLATGGTYDVQVTGAGGVPGTGVSGAILNVTATNTTSTSFLTVWPKNSTRPVASNVNWTGGQTVPNRVIVPIDASGKVSVYNAVGAVDVVVDVSGYFTDATMTGKQFTPQTPIRILDTRTASLLGQGAVYTLQVSGVAGVPANATAVTINVTVTNTSAASFLTVYPCGTRPTASDLNWSGGQTIANLTVATLSGTGTICLYNAAGSTDVVVDQLGYFN
jgi:outer membrane protein assembly factor BamB